MCLAIRPLVRDVGILSEEEGFKLRRVTAGHVSANPARGMRGGLAA